MRKIALALTAASVLLAAPAVQARDKQTPEQRLAKLLEGRVAGKPVSCLSTMNTRDQQVFDKTAIVFGTGTTIYVNRPPHPESLDSDQIMVTEIHGDSLCSMDTIKMHDRGTHMFSGIVGLGQFVPYTKVVKPKG